LQYKSADAFIAARHFPERVLHFSHSTSKKSFAQFEQSQTLIFFRHFLNFFAPLSLCGHLRQEEVSFCAKKKHTKKTFYSLNEQGRLTLRWRFFTLCTLKPKKAQTKEIRQGCQRVYFQNQCPFGTFCGNLAYFARKLWQP
jgi:hypothetical protein